MSVPASYEVAIWDLDRRILASFAIPPYGLGSRCTRCGALSPAVDMTGCCPRCDPGAAPESPLRFDDHGPVTRYAPIMTGRGRWRCWCGRRFWTWPGYEEHWRRVRG